MISLSVARELSLLERESSSSSTPSTSYSLLSLLAALSLSRERVSLSREGVLPTLPEYVLSITALAAQNVHQEESLDDHEGGGKKIEFI